MSDSSSAREMREAISLYLLLRFFQASIHSLLREISWSIFCAEILSSQKPGSDVLD